MIQSITLALEPPDRTNVEPQAPGVHLHNFRTLTKRKKNGRREI